MDGRAAMIRRVYPAQFNSSVGAALWYSVPKGLQNAALLEAPLVTVRAWEMNSGYSDRLL